MRSRRRCAGLTLLEMLPALAIASVLMAALAGVVGQSLQAWAATREHTALSEDGRFAMERMVAAVRDTSRLILPLGENPATAWSESVRDVLAVTLAPTLDRDRDGFADADNDRDGRVDEDPPQDNTKDLAHGIVGIDDDGDGAVDEGAPDASGHFKNNDEAGTDGDDVLDGIDNDGDGSVDEDWKSDVSGDGASGLIGVDDDGDGLVDEGPAPDDDEDGANDEDWIDPIVFFLSGSTLIERLPNLDPVDGLDFTERPIAENVNLLRVERLATSGARAELVDITLQIASPSGEIVDLHTRVRVGGGS